MAFLDTIIWRPMPTDQYMTVETSKEQIYLHHTAGSSNPYEVFTWWQSTTERVGTAFVIGGPTTSTTWIDGQIVQGFSSKMWAWHLGVTVKDLLTNGKSSTWLNSHSVGIELCNWGQLTQKNGTYVNYQGGTVPEDQVVTYDAPFRGYTHYHKYSDAQLESTRQLLIYLGQTWNIDITYKGIEMFDINPRCLMGEGGVWTHCSVRPTPEKFDLNPQPNLLSMLSTL